MHKLTARGLVLAILLGAFFTGSLAAQNTPGPENGKRYPRLAIRNAFAVDGNGTPMAGPKTSSSKTTAFVSIVPLDPMASRGGRRRQPADAEIDATGKYVLPGLINAHAHVQDERGGIPQPRL
jgi:hypothetical protein